MCMPYTSQGVLNLTLLGQLDAGGVCRQNVELSGHEQGWRWCVECGLARLRSRGRSGFVRWTYWGQFFWFVRWRGDDWRDLLTDIARGDAGVLVLTLMLDVTHGSAGGHANERGDVSAAVIEGVSVGVDGVVVTAVAGVEGAGGVSNDDVGVGRTGIVHGIAFAVAVALAFGVGVGVDGASVAGDAGSVDVGIAVAVGIAALVVIIAALVGVDGVGSGDEAVGVVGVEGAYSIDDAVAAAAAVCAVAVRTRGGLGVHEVGSGGSSEVGVEGVLLVFERKMLRLVGAFRVMMKNGGKVVGWVQ